MIPLSRLAELNGHGVTARARRPLLRDRFDVSVSRMRCGWFGRGKELARLGRLPLPTPRPVERAGQVVAASRLLDASIADFAAFEVVLAAAISPVTAGPGDYGYPAPPEDRRLSFPSPALGLLSCVRASDGRFVAIEYIVV